jgi:hypothetical protein
LLGVFNELAQDGETWAAEVDRLSTSYSTGASKFEAYGYDMADVAQITDAAVTSMRDAATQSADDTLNAMVAMGEAAGLTSDQLSSLTDALSTSGTAASATDEEISKLMEANWVSDAEDKVGGEDAFNTIMDNLISNEFDTISKYADNLDYYTQRAESSISNIGAASVTVDNFWDSLNAALKAGMTTDQFELWGKASTWVNAIDTVNDSLDQWNEGMLQLDESLDARMETAQGFTYQATVTKQLASAEKELYDAREAGYDAAYITRLQEVQAAELQAIIAAHAETYASDMRDYAKRYATAIGDSGALVEIAMEENAKAFKDLEKEFNNSVGSADAPLFAALERAQHAEIIKMIEDTANTLATATDSMKADLAARQATIAGYDEEATALQKVKGYTDELNKAYEDGLDSSLIAELQQTELDELAKYWSDTIDKMKLDLVSLYKTQSDILNSLSGTTTDAMAEIATLMTRYRAGETGLADTILSDIQTIGNAFSSMVDDIASTIYDIRTGTDTSTTTPVVTTANALAYFNEEVAKAASGDTTAMANVANYGKTYIQDLKESTTSASDYQAGVDYVTTKLASLSTGASSGISGLSGIAQQVTNDQIAEAEKALKKAQVAQLETTYETLYAQALSAFKASQAGTYISGFATTGAGWKAFTDLFVDYDNNGTTRLQEIQSGQINWVDYIGWFLNNTGTGSGSVDWDSAMTLWKQYAALPSDVSSLYGQAQTAYTNWQTLKSQYGFAAGGMITGGIPGQDSTLALAQPGEAILDVEQTGLVRNLGDILTAASGGGRDDLLAEVVALRKEVAAFRRENREATKSVASNTNETAGMLKKCGGKTGFISTTTESPV